MERNNINNINNTISFLINKSLKQICTTNDVFVSFNKKILSNIWFVDNQILIISYYEIDFSSIRKMIIDEKYNCDAISLLYFNISIKTDSDSDFDIDTDWYYEN